MDQLHPIAGFVQAFFQAYLAAQRALSANTILSYRDSLKLLLRFASKQLGKPADKLAVEHFDEKMVAAFLDELEDTRGNCTRTRNTRLAALRSFFRYVAVQEPTVVERCRRICGIPLKRTEHKMIECLDDKEMRALLESVEQHSRMGPRDYALLLFLYNTGARVQEAVDVRINDLRLERPFQVKLTGKGMKERVLPIWPETVGALQNYLKQRIPDVSEESHLFLNANGHPITRFGIRHIVARYASRAGERCSSLKSKKVTPHWVRHSTALHLLQSGSDMSVVKDWLGHADINTTHAYVEIDMKMKSKALEACHPPRTRTSRKRGAKWRKPGVLKWLDELSRPARIMCSAAHGSVATTP